MWVEPGLPQNAGHEAYQTLLAELTGREVHRHSKGRKAVSLPGLAVDFASIVQRHPFRNGESRVLPRYFSAGYFADCWHFPQVGIVCEQSSGVEVAFTDFDARKPPALAEGSVNLQYRRLFCAEGKVRVALSCGSFVCGYVTLSSSRQSFEAYK